MYYFLEAVDQTNYQASSIKGRGCSAAKDSGDDTGKKKKKKCVRERKCVKEEVKEKKEKAFCFRYNSKYTQAV